MTSPEQQLRNACWFSKIPGAGECEGPTVVRCHLLDQQQMKKRWPKGCNGRSLVVLQADPRGWRWGCGGIVGIGGHHGKLDTAPHDRTRLRVPRVLIPEETEELAVELDMEAWMERRYGPR